MATRSDTGTGTGACFQLLLPLDLPRGRTFRSFTSAGNEAPVEYLQRLCEGDKDRRCQQLYFWGAASTGKSHLLQAACRAVTDRGGRSAWLPLTRLLPYGPQALADFATVDLIGVDELDVIRDRLDWQRALFDLINEVRLERHCLVMSSRQNPMMGEWQLRDLPSRLVWGAVYRLAPLGDTARIEVLRGVAERLGHPFGDEVLTYLLNSYPRELKKLVGIIEHLSDCAKQRKQRITIPFARKMLLSE